MVKLRYQDDQGREATVVLEGEGSAIRIGRGKQCRLRTKNATVSSVHCEVRLADGVLSLTDLNSSNGTFHGHRRIRAADLSHGDVFFCGNFAVTVAWPGEGEEPDVGDGGDREGTAVAEPAPLIPAFSDVVQPTPLPQPRTAMGSPEEREEPTMVNTGWLVEDVVQEIVDVREAITTPGAQVPGEQANDDATRVDMGAHAEVVVGDLSPSVDVAMPSGHESTRTHTIEDYEGAQRSLDIGTLLEEATRRIDALQAELDMVRSDGAGQSLAADLATANERFAQVVGERDSFATELEAARTERDAQATVLQVAQDALATLEARTAELEAEVEELGTRLEVALAEVVRAREDMAALQQSHEGVEERATIAEGQRDEITVRLEEAEVAREGLELRASELAAAQDELEARSRDAHRSLEEAEERTRSLQKERDDLKDRVAESERALQDAQGGASDLEAERDRLRAALEAAQEARRGSEERETALQVEWDSSAEGASAARQELDEAEERAADLQERMGAAEQALQDATERAGSLEESRDDLRVRVEALELALEEAAERATAANTNMEEASTGHARALDEAARSALEARSRAEAAEGELDLGEKSWQAIEAELRAENKSLNDALSAAVEPSTFADLERRAGSSEEGRLEALAEVARLQDLATGQEGRAEASSGRAAELAASLAEITDAHEAGSREIQELKALLLDTVSSDEVESYRVRIEQLEQTVHQAEAKRQRHAEQARAESQRASETEAALSEATETSRELGDEVSRLNKQLTALDGELQSAREQVAQAVTRASGGVEAAEQLAKAISERRAAEEERDGHEAALEVVRTRRDALEAELASRDRNLTAAERKAADVQAELDDLRADTSGAEETEREMERLTAELDTLRETVTSAEAALADERRALEGLREETRGGAEAITAAGRERARAIGALEDLRAEVESLRQLAGASESSAFENLQTFRSAIRNAFDEINDLASEWKPGVSVLQGYFEDIQEGFADPGARDSTYETLRETLEALVKSSAGVKERLKAVRKLLGD